MKNRLFFACIILCLSIACSFQPHCLDAQTVTVSENAHKNLDAGDLGTGLKNPDSNEWLRWVSIAIDESERHYSRMKAGSASVASDPGSAWTAGAYLHDKEGIYGWTPGGYGGKHYVTFRGVENIGPAKQYRPIFKGTVEFFGTGGGGKKKPDYVWDVKAEYDVIDKRIKKITILVHVTKGSFHTQLMAGTTADRDVMIHQQETTERTSDWVWSTLKNFGGTLLDAVNMQLQNGGKTLVTRLNYSTQFFPAVAGYGSMLLLYYESMLNLGDSITGYSITKTKSRVNVLIERANGEQSYKTIDVTLKAVADYQITGTPLDNTARDAQARDAIRGTVAKDWQNSVFNEIKNENGKIIKDRFGKDVTEDIIIEFKF